MSQTILVTGASRGIGLSLCKENIKRGHRVYGVCRTSSQALSDSGAQVIEGVDLADLKTIDKLKAGLDGVALDVLINNAGILKDEAFGNINYDTIVEQFEVNAVGPLAITESLAAQLNSGSKVAFITSRMGSITDNTSGGRYGYRMSKTALNIAAVSVSQDLKQLGVAVAILHPGLVGTDMIGGQGNITPDQAAEQLMQRIDALTLESSGTFWHANGEVLPW